MDGELTSRLKVVPIKIIATAILMYLLKIPIVDHGVFLNILTYAIIAVAIYGFVSFFGMFFRGGRIIGGIITSVIVIVILAIYFQYAEDGLVKNIVLYGICFGGFVLDIIALIAGLVSHKKAKADAKREAEYEESAYLQAMQAQAAQQSYQQQMQNGYGQKDYSSDGNALQEVINQYYESEERAKKLFEEIAAIVVEQNLSQDDMQKLADEHDDIRAVTEAIRGRLQQQNYQNSDLASFRDRYSQCYTDMEILIRKLEAYLSRIRN